MKYGLFLEIDNRTVYRLEKQTARGFHIVQYNDEGIQRILPNQAL